MLDDIKRALGFKPRLNCRPGEMARVVAGARSGEYLKQIAGCIVTVRTPGVIKESGLAGWSIDERLMVRADDGRDYKVALIADKVLRPIRNPSDEDRDEMLSLVGPAPKVERVESDSTETTMGA